MVKSGGEWISSVDLETAIIAHPDVLEAAVIAIPHPTWVERPLACVVPREGARENLDRAQVLDLHPRPLRPLVAARRRGVYRRNPQDQRGQV